MIYLDHNATTDIYPEVLDKMREIMNYGPLNASSIHSNGQKAKATLEYSRRSIAKLLGFQDCRRKYQITFTSTGTEANNLVISNFKDHEIFISAIEHPSIYGYTKIYDNINIINVDHNGVLDLDDLEAKLHNSKSDIKLVSVMLANNETGVIQPVKKICEIAYKYGAYIHSDAVQAIGKVATNIIDLGVDFLSISAHKFGGPIGASALISKSSINLKSLMVGGGQERSLRPGTENISAIAGFGVAAELVYQNLQARSEHMLNLQKKLEESILLMPFSFEIANINTKRLPNTSLILGSKKNAQTQLVALDLKNIAVSAGSACSSGKVTPSHVLSACGYEASKIASAIRVSIGMSNTFKDIYEFITTYNEINK